MNSLKWLLEGLTWYIIRKLPLGHAQCLHRLMCSGEGQRGQDWFLIGRPGSGLGLGLGLRLWLWLRLDVARDVVAHSTGADLFEQS